MSQGSADKTAEQNSKTQVREAVSKQGACLSTVSQKRKEIKAMSSKNKSKKSQALSQFKMEAAREVGVDLKNDGYNGVITSKQAGSVGGQMVKKMVEAYEQALKD